MMPINNQRGSVLIISLLLLIVTTIIGLSSMQETVMEERMAGNLRTFNVAVQNAESGLRTAENWVSQLDPNDLPSTVAAATDANIDLWALHGPEGVANPTGLWWTTATNWSDKSEVDANNASTRYFIEKGDYVRHGINMGTATDFEGLQYYQVTSRGAGQGGRSNIYLRSTYVITGTGI